MDDLNARGIRRRNGRVLRAVLALATATAPAACGDGPTDAPGAPDVRPYVTGAAAAAVDPNGLFRLPSAEAPDDLPIISASTAASLAEAYVRSLGPSFQAQWEGERGTAIPLEQLRPEPRILFAQSPYGRFPDGYHPAFRRIYGPAYLVRFTLRGRPAVVVGVSAYNAEVRIGADGMLTFPALSGAEFIALGVPVDTAVFRPLSPEEAVVRIARLTGARVAEVPEYQLPGRPYGPPSALWKLVLDRDVPVRVLATGESTLERVFYIGPEREHRLLLAARDQPSSYPASAIPLGDISQPPVFETVELQIVPGRPVSFESVVLD